MMNGNPGEKHSTIKITRFSGAQNISVVYLVHRMTKKSKSFCPIKLFYTFTKMLFAQRIILLPRDYDSSGDVVFTFLLSIGMVPDVSLIIP